MADRWTIEWSNDLLAEILGALDLSRSLKGFDVLEFPWRGKALCVTSANKPSGGCQLSPEIISPIILSAVQAATQSKLLDGFDSRQLLFSHDSSAYATSQELNNPLVRRRKL